MIFPTSFDDDDWDALVPYEMFYYWHPESDSLFEASEELDNQELERLTYREFVLLNLLHLDAEAFDLILDAFENPHRG